MPSAGEQLDLERLHPLRLVLGLVVVPEQVQRAVHHQVGRCAAERLALGCRLAQHGLERHRDVAERAAARRPASGVPGSQAGKESTLVGLSLPRQSRFSSRTRPSSASRTLTSGGARE